LCGLIDCFRKGLLRKVEPSSSKSGTSLSEALNWLEEAHRNLQAQALRSALSSSYNATFHASRDVLFRDGVREKSHFCIGEYIIGYVELDLLEYDRILLLSRLRNIRHSNQYSFNPAPSKEEAEAMLESAEKNVNRIAKLLDETSYSDCPESWF
jgi:uncharacterized protein (UPF0332 family)